MSLGFEAGRFVWRRSARRFRPSCSGVGPANRHFARKGWCRSGAGCCPRLDRCHDGIGPSANRGPSTLAHLQTGRVKPEIGPLAGPQVTEKLMHPVIYVVHSEQRGQAILMVIWVGLSREGPSGSRR